ncbi:MAG: fibronectin type III domain-containing protein, partial [Balneolaceae bacterium]
MSYEISLIQIIFFSCFTFSVSSISAQNAGRVSLSAPEHGAEDVSLQPVLEWKSGGGAIRYQLMLSRTEDFSDPLINERGIRQTSFKVDEDLDFNTEYFWRVRGATFFRTGRWSDVWSFRTEGLPSPENL